MKLVSVIIPNHNYGQYLSRAIESVLCQTYRNLEVIVVDNGSTDNSIAVASKFDGVVVIRQEDKGQAMARNIGVSYAKGTLLAFLDADDYWGTDKIQKQIELISRETQLVFSPIIRIDENGKEIGKKALQDTCTDFSRKALLLPGASIIEAGESCILMTKSLFNMSGGFDVHLDSSSGWDLFRRCAKLTRFKSTDDSLVFYRVHSSNMSNNLQHNLKNMLKAYKKVFQEEKGVLVWVAAVKLDIAALKSYLKKKKTIKSIYQAICWPFLRSLIELRFKELIKSL